MTNPYYFFMPVIVAKPGDKKYLLSNGKIFLQRNANSSFTSKWDGVWEGDFKLFEKFNYEVIVNNERYNLSEHCTKIQYNGWKALHEFSIKKLMITESIFIPLKGKAIISNLQFKNESENKILITVFISAGVNHRNKETDWHDTQYEHSYNNLRDYVTVKSGEKNYSIFGVDKKDMQVKFVPNDVYEEYSFEGKQQRYFSPGKFMVQFELKPNQLREFKIFYSCSKQGLHGVLTEFVDLYGLYALREKNTREHFQKLIRKYLVKMSPEMEEIIEWLLISFNHLQYDNNYFAGLPWFTSYWGRDLLWSFNAFLHIGEFEKCKNILQMLKDNAQETNNSAPTGTIPNFIRLDGEVNYDSIDATPLFIISLYEYVKYTNDKNFLMQNRDLFNVFMAWFEKLDDEGYLRNFNTKKLTWMDTVRRNKGIEVQALYLKSSFFDDMIEVIKKRLDEYWLDNENYFKDTPSDESLRPNQLVPLLFDFVPKDKAEKVLELMINPAMLSKKGLRTLSKDDKKYNPSEYHNGRVWGLVTGWLLCCLFKYSKLEKASELLQNWSEDLKEYTLGCLTETFHGDSLEPMGCGCQLWNGAMIIRAIDEFIFGIHPNIPRKELVLSPTLLTGKIERFDKRIEDALLDVSIECDNKTAKFLIRLSKPKEWMIKISPRNYNVKKMLVDNKEVEGEKFKAKLEHTIELILK